MTLLISKKELEKTNRQREYNITVGLMTSQIKPEIKKLAFFQTPPTDIGCASQCNFPVTRLFLVLASSTSHSLSRH